MLNPSILERTNAERKEIDRASNEHEGNDGARNDEKDKNDDKNENDEASDDENNEPDELRNDENDEIVENDETLSQADNVQGIRRSTREHKQRIKITPDEIGDCDDENDKDYK